jgi:hypothetical protein
LACDADEAAAAGWEGERPRFRIDRKPRQSEANRFHEAEKRFTTIEDWTIRALEERPRVRDFAGMTKQCFRWRKH